MLCFWPSSSLRIYLSIYIYICFSRSPDLQQLSDKWEILLEQIEFEEELGRGAFGVVYKATFSKSDEMEALVTETSKWPSSSRKPKAPQVVAVKVLHGKKYFNLHKGETKPQALEIITYFQFFICNKKGFFKFSFGPYWGKKKDKNQNNFFYIFIFFVAVGIVVVVVYSFHHCSPSKTTVKAWDRINRVGVQGSSPHPPWLLQ